MQRISQILEIPLQINWSHFTYLGLPLAREVVKSKVWNKKVERMREKKSELGNDVAQPGRKSDID